MTHESIVHGSPSSHGDSMMDAFVVAKEMIKNTSIEAYIFSVKSKREKE